MRILVTGSSGTIGTRLCEKLLAEGHQVAGIDWEPNTWNQDIEAITTHLDLRSADQLTANSSQLTADMIIHLAANARVYELVEHPDRARDNILTTFNVLEFARQHSIPRFIFASSREVYGNIDAETFTEDLAQFSACESPYTASKIAGEAFVESYKRCYQIDSIVLRFSNVYGMYDNSIRVVPLFFRQAHANETITVYGKDKYLDFTYIDDTVHGIRLCIDQFDEAKNETYNIAFGEGNSILHLAELMKEHLGSTSPIEMGNVRTGEIVRYVADITKARQRLGFQPQVPFEQGIQKAVEWYSKNKM